MSECKPFLWIFSFTYGIFFLQTIHSFIYRRQIYKFHKMRFFSIFNCKYYQLLFLGSHYVRRTSAIRSHPVWI